MPPTFLFGHSEHIRMTADKFGNDMGSASIINDLQTLVLKIRQRNNSGILPYKPEIVNDFELMKTPEEKTCICVRFYENLESLESQSITHFGSNQADGPVQPVDML